jgi:hypothetical protein
MPGSKTRPGFFAGGEPPASKPDEDPSPRAARTVIGHEMHLRTPLAPRPAAQAAPLPVETSVPEPITDETTDQLPPRPSHTGKSKFPAFARLLGRWTTGGGFLSRSGMFGGTDDLPRVPRDPWVSRVAIFMVAALFSFLVALAVLKLHRCSEPGSPPLGTTPTSTTPAPPAPTTAEAAPAPPPPPPAPPSLPSAAAASDVPFAQPRAVRPKATRQPAPRTVSPSSRTAPAERGSFRGQRGLPPTKAADSLLPLGI